MDNPDKPMGLLRLPPEIRDQIYTILLHPSNNRTFKPDEYTDYDYRAAFVVFRLNQQIYYEARAIFRLLNVFVRVETPWSEAEQHVNFTGHVPILVRGARAAAFMGHTLRIEIQTPENDVYNMARGRLEQGMHCFVMLADDLAGFTKSWFYSNLSHPGLNRWLSLTLTLRDPHAPDWDEKFVRRDVQRRLLLPFGEITGLRSFEVTGDPMPMPKIVAELRALQAVETKPPEECLAEGARLKQEGNELLGKGEYRAALEMYRRAWEAVHIVVKGRQRHVHAEAFFARELKDGRNGQLERMHLRIQLVANTCQVYLKLEDWDELRFWGMRTIEHMRQATGANDRFLDPEDEALLGFPSAPLVGKIYYRTAVALEALGDRDGARRLARVAAVYMPQDQAVKKMVDSFNVRIG